MNSEIESNAEQLDPSEMPSQVSAKLSTRSKIAQCVETLSNDLSSCIVMDLDGC